MRYCYDMAEMVGRKRIDGGQYWTHGCLVVQGCTPVSVECVNCWARGYHQRFGGILGGDRFEQITVHLNRLEEKACKTKPAVISIWNDLFHEMVSRADIDRVFAVIERRPRNLYIACTKRAERACDYLSGLSGSVPCNLIVGITAGTGERLNDAIRLLRRIKKDNPAATTMLSIEPILSEIVLPEDAAQWIDWVTTGCETGPNARISSHTVQWLQNLASQCLWHKIPLFVKAVPNRLGDCKWTYEKKQVPCWAVRQFPNETQ